MTEIAKIFQSLVFEPTCSEQGNLEERLINFLSKPHDPIARNTVSSWTKKVLGVAGIDTEKFGAHFTRAASSSAVISEGMVLMLI